MSLKSNMLIAEAAVEYVAQKVHLGASNKPIDVLHAEMNARRADSGRGWVARTVFPTAPALTDKSTENQRNSLAQSSPDSIKNGPIENRVLWNASQSEASGIGNCGEQASVAFKYLHEKTKNTTFSLCKLGHNHELVVIGVKDQLIGKYHYVDIVPADWPNDAVICDPWYHDWFSVKSDWSRKIRSILRETEPGWIQVQVKMAVIASRNLIGSAV